MTVAKTTQKIEYISFLQSFAITLVLLGHSFPYINGTETFPAFAKIIIDVIYSFHMPLFFVLAGFLLMNSFYKQSQTIQNFTNFIKNKFIRLIIPYFTIGSLAFLLKVFIFNKFSYHPANWSFSFYIKSMLIPNNNPNGFLWFLPTMFFILILSFLVLNKDNYKKFNPILWIILSLIVSFLSQYTHIQWLNISGILKYLFYFFLGVFFFNIKDSLLKITSNSGVLVFMLLLFAELQIVPIFQHNSVNYIMHYIAAILGILISIGIAKNFCDRGHKFFGGIIDGKYYQIYLLSWFFQYGTRVFYQMGMVNYITVCLLMLISGFIFPILITNIIKKYFPFLKVFIGL